MDDETIREKRLGYAPADTKDRLLAYLHRRGFDRETILATGLFREWDDGNLSATRAGRYDTDDDPAKYHKLPVSRDVVVVEESIYGLNTVNPGEPVLITEGIADAITAHQAGYACVSPVTTSFKTSDRERLVDALDAAEELRPATPPPEGWIRPAYPGSRTAPRPSDPPTVGSCGRAASADAVAVVTHKSATHVISR